MNACTIVARNYLPFARVLARSFLDHHPDASFFVLLVDDERQEFDASSERFECLRPTDIGVHVAEAHRLAMIYDATEYSTAVKPMFLRYLVDRYPPTITYLDPDIWVHGPLEDLDALAQSDAIVLTPHRTVPLEADGRTPTDADLRSAGVFNLGFIALGPGSEPFLDWWSERLRFDAIRDVENDLFTDQRWIDMVPAYYRHSIVRDEGCNVAYWNLDSRQLALDGNRYLVNGMPLRFFHFSGFSPQTPEILTKHHAGSPRIRLSHLPVVARICREYSALLNQAGYGAGTPYGYDVLPNGVRVDRFMRHLYRHALLAVDAGESERLPDPFDSTDTEAFMEWLRTPIGSRTRSAVPRYLLEIYRQRPDLRRLLPRVPGSDTSAYLGWVSSVGRYEYKFPRDLLPRSETLPTHRRGAVLPDTPGLNVVGYFRTETGVGEAGRAVLRAVDASGVPFRAVVYDRTLSRQDHPFVETEHQRLYDTNLICINADQVPSFGQEIGPSFFRSRYSIGMWHWEVEEFPWSLHDAFRYVQEVWVASDFIRDSVAKVAPCPVHTFPPPVAVAIGEPQISRSDLGLPDRFMFLFVFDFYSVMQRKNPLALIDAFRRAFPSPDGPVLFLKSVNGNQKPLDLEVVRAEVSKHPDVHLLDGYMDAAATRSLMGSADCYVSLHRAEGFGLTMAEAMALGKPVIATGYSGNLTFMNEANSYLVPYTLIPIGSGMDPYPADARWAEPDIDAAALAMQEVYDDPDRSRARGELARLDIAALLSPEARAGFIRDRVEVGRKLRVLALERASLPSRGDVTHRWAGSSVLRAPARILLRAARAPAEALRTPSPRFARSAPLLRRILRRPYRLIWRVGSGLSEPARGRRHD